RVRVHGRPMGAVPAGARRHRGAHWAPRALPGRPGGAAEPAPASRLIRCAPGADRVARGRRERTSTATRSGHAGGGGRKTPRREVMMVKLTITEPDLEVREPALARGSLAALGSLLVVLVARRLGVDPQLVGGAVGRLAPLVAGAQLR